MSDLEAYARSRFGIFGTVVLTVDGDTIEGLHLLEKDDLVLVGGDINATEAAGSMVLHQVTSPSPMPDAALATVLLETPQQYCGIAGSASLVPRSKEKSVRLCACHFPKRVSCV